MAKVLVTDTHLINIANAIRIKKGSSTTYKPSEMADAISSIETGSGEGVAVPSKGLIIHSWDDGYATSGSIVGMTSIPNYYLNQAGYINGSNRGYLSGITTEFNLPNNLTSIGSYAFASFTSLAITSIPSTITKIGNYAFRNCTNLALTSLPSGITELSTGAFQYCENLKKMTIEGNITRIKTQCFQYCTNLKLLLLPNVTTVVTLENVNSLANGSIADGNGYICVPNNLVSGYRSASNWSTYANQIIGIDLESIAIVCNEEINIAITKTMPIKIAYNNVLDSLYHEEQMGYTLTINNPNATFSNGILTVNDSFQEGDTLTITATSTYDPTITATKNIVAVYEEAKYEINLNDGQWIDSGTTINGKTVYKSDAGSYHINDGKSVATITTVGLTHLKLYLRSYGESGYDYAEAFEIDAPATRGTGKFTTINKSSSTNYIECIYELDGGIHTINIMYSKDSSVDNSDDRGYFYIDEAS